jgi:sucrose-phosphate synthase
MSSGLPAVVTMYGGPSDVLFENNTKYGVLVDVFNEEKIAIGLHDGLDNHSEYKKIGIKRVLDKYTWDATATKYLNSIKNILNLNSNPENIDLNPYFQDPDNSEITLDLIRTKIL